MDVTVVIPAGPPGHWHSLARAVASARAQTHRPAEVIVVVGHDTPYYHRVRRDLSGVTVLESCAATGARRGGVESFRSCAGCLDTGAFHAITSLVAFLAHDVIADPGWLAPMVRAFTDPAVVGAGGGLRPDWRDGRPRWLADELHWAVTPGAGPAGTIVRRDLFREIGGFGRRAAELPQRLSALTGGSWRHLPDAVVRQEVPRHEVSFPAFLRRCFAEGRPALVPAASAALGNLQAALIGGAGNVPRPNGSPGDHRDAQARRAGQSARFDYVAGPGVVSLTDHLWRAGCAVAGMAAAAAGMAATTAGTLARRTPPSTAPRPPTARTATRQALANPEISGLSIRRKL